ncbi:unnamed protein product [Rotaria sp. Silwood1]|nr:unnamed protein product [Rotaria sp. Silwood1]
MEHLYKSGMVHLLNEPANLEIDYLINKNQGMVTHRPDNRKYEKQESYSSDGESDKNSDYDDARQEDAHNNEDNSDEESDNDENEAQLDKNNLKFTLSKADIDDHKRQLTFCRVDLDEDMIDKRNLLDEQLTLLKRIDEIFSLLTKLEMDGHPAYQLMDKHIKINYRAIDLYARYQISYDANVEKSLDNLSRFLNKLFPDESRLPKDETRTGHQYIIAVKSSRQTTHDHPLNNTLDMDTWCTLLNLFQDQLPSSNQILWCTKTTEDDIKLFYLRIRKFCNLIFVVLNLDKMHPRLRELLLNEQESLSQSKQAHGTVYYFSRELASRRGVESFPASSQNRINIQIKSNLVNLFRKATCAQPQINVIDGKSGIGK